MLKKILSIFITTSFVFTSLPSAFAVTAELTLGENQQYVPVVSYDPAANTTTTTSVGAMVPSGSAIQSSSPLSAPSSVTTANTTATTSVVVNGDFTQNTGGTSFPDGWEKFWTSDASNPQYLASYDGRTGVVNLSRSTAGVGLKQNFMSPVGLNAAGQFEVTFKIVLATLAGDGSYGIEAPFVFQLDIEKADGTTSQIRKYFNYTSDSNSASNPNFILVPQNQWITKTYTLQELGLSTGDRLKDVAVFSNGWNRESYVDSVALYPEEVPPVEMVFSGGYSLLPTGSQMTVTAATSPPVDSYAWYLDGTVVNGATTSQVTVGSGLAVGSHALLLQATLNGISYTKQYSFDVIDLNQLQITFSGLQEQLPRGSTMDVVVTTSPWNVDSYQWYLDGTAIPGATAKIVTIGSGVAAGDHSLRVETMLSGIAKSQEVPFSVIDLGQYALLNITNQYASTAAPHLQQDSRTYTHCEWYPVPGTVCMDYEIGTSSYNYGIPLQLSRSHVQWNPPSQPNGHTYEDRVLVEFDLSPWYSLNLDPTRIARVELLATATGSGDAFQGYDFSINSMQALEDGLFTSAQDDFNVTTAPIQTVYGLQLNSTPQELYFDVTDLLRNDLIAGNAWSGIVFKPEATNLPVMQLADPKLRVYYNAGTDANPVKPVLTSTVPEATNGTTLALSGTKEANTAILINGAQVVPMDSLTTWTATVNLTTEGNNPIIITARNSSDLVSEPLTLNVVRDTQAPTGSLNINSGAAYATSQTVSLTLSATDSLSGISTMSFSTNGTAWSTAETYAATKTFTLPSGDGQKTVYVKYFDKAGNASAAYSKNIFLDVTVPTGSIAISSGAPYAASTSVTLNLSGVDTGSGINMMSFSTDNTTWSAAEAYAATKFYTLPAGDGTKTVYVKFYDKAGNVSQVYLDTIILDTATPAGTITVNGGVSYINQTAVTLNLAATDAGSGVGAMSFSTNGTTWTATEAYATTKAWTFAAGDGNKIVYVKFLDNSGKWSAVTSAAVILDTVKPTGSLNINSGAAYATSQTVTLNLAASDSLSGIGTVSFSTNGTTWSTAEAYAASKTFALPVGDGTKTVYVKYFDKAGNASAIYSKSIILDVSAPTGSIKINSGATYTTSTSVTLNLSGADTGSGLSKMSFSTNGTTWSTAEAYATSKTYTLPNGDGTKTVYVKFYDKAGNVSTVYSDSIILDTVAPSGTIKVNGGVSYINQTAVTLNLAATDAGSGVSMMSFSTNGKTWTTAEAYSTTKAWTFASGDGTKTVYVKFQDRSGKWSTATSVTVTLDTVKPTGSININSGATYAASASVTLNLSAADSRSGISTMSFSTDGTTWAAPVSYATSAMFTLPAGDGTKTVYVKYFDKAGNASAVYSKAIILDTLAPTGTVQVNGGVSYINQTAVTLNLSATDAGSGLSMMSFSTNGTMWSTAEAYAATKAWTFASGDGAKTVYVKFQDKSGKWSAVTSVTVTLDTVKPTGSLNINSGAAYTNSTNVMLNLSGTDNSSGIGTVSFSGDGTTWSTAEAYATSKTFTLPAGDGTKTVYIKYFDKAGNASAVYSKSIILDTIAPAVVLSPETPTTISEHTLTINYTVDGVSKGKTFSDLTEGENTLTITENDLAGNQTIVNWTVTVSTVPWIPAPSNANYSFRVTQDASGYRLELRYNPGGGITVLSTGTGPAPDTFDVTPDGSKVIFEGNGNAYVQRIGEPWTARTVEGDLAQILYYNDYVMLKTDRTYPSGTVIRTSTGIRIGTFNPEFISTFYLTVVTPGAGFYRNDSLSIAVQPEYDQASGQYYAHIYSLYGGNDYSSSVRTVSLGNETPGSEGGTFTLVDAVVAPGGQTVLAIGLDSPTFNKTFLVNQNITFDGAATAVMYQNNIANYTVRDNDGSTRAVRFDLNKLEFVPELPAVELVQPVITQVPNPLNQFTLKFDQAMRGVRYEVQFRTSLTSGDWQTAGEFVADHYGEVTWQDPVQDRGNTVFYRVVAHEITTAADLLTQINMLYFDSEFGLVDPAHEYPLEGWLQRRITQPSNFGFYANLLASIAAGDLVTATISKTEAIRRLDVMMTHLLEDQQTLGYRGLLPWLGYYNGDWRRMDDIYGRQVSFEDNTNMTAGLAVAYGALLDDSLAGSATIHAAGGILDKIDAFLANQRDGYVAMYNEANQTFARTMVIADGHLEGTVDLFGAESMGPLLFLILQYGDAFPASTYNKLHFSTSTYTMQDGTTRTVVEPFSGAFQMYWPALFMPEAGEPDLRAMLETYTDVQLDYASRNNQPGILSASYDVGSYDLLSRYVGAFSWAGDAVSGVREGDGSFHVTSPTSNGIGVYFADDSKFVFEGSTVQLRYSSQTVVPNARLEFKQMIDGVLQIVHVENLSLENTGGEVRTLTLTLPESGTLGDLKEVVFAVSGGTGPLDLTFHQINTDRIQYNFSLGINEIAMNGVSETTPSTYNLGAAYMFRPAGVEVLLQRLITEHPELITSHGLWEGINMTSGKVVKEQVFNNVVSFTLGMAGTGGFSMASYLEHKGLTSKLESIWDPQAPVSLTSGTSGNFEWNGFKGTAWHLPEAVCASGRELHIAYQSSEPITGVKLELKHAGSNDPAYSVQFDFPATGSGPGEYVITIPESYLYWYITDAVVLFPEAQGFPNAKITGMTLTPANDTVPPVLVIDAGTPHLINLKTLTVSYTSDGVAKTKVFDGLSEGVNTLTITETDFAGNTTTVTHQVTVDTIAPVVVLDPQTPTWIASSSMVVYYTLDGALKQKIFTDLVVGVNRLVISETDPAGNQTTVNFNVSRPQGTDFLKGQITTFALNGGNAAASWDSGVLHVTSSNFKGVGVAAILNPTSINVRQVQISYSSLTPVPNARIEYKARDASGKLITVKTQYLSLQNTGGIVKTVTTDLIFSGYPALDEIVFVTDGAGTSTLDMKIYGFAGF